MDLTILQFLSKATLNGFSLVVLIFPKQKKRVLNVCYPLEIFAKMFQYKLCYVIAFLHIAHTHTHASIAFISSTYSHLPWLKFSFIICEMETSCLFIYIQYMLYHFCIRFYWDQE